MRLHRRSLQSVALLCITGIIASLSPVNAEGTDLSGVNPLSKWAASMPATCGFYQPSVNYWLGSALGTDWKQVPVNKVSEWIRRGKHGEEWGVARISAYYDPVHRIGYYDEFGTDMSNSALVGDVSAPPAGEAKTRDLSGVTFAKNIHLGDSVAQVAEDIGLKGGLHPAPGKGACKEFSMVGFCSWNKKGCECPNGYDPDREAGTVIFRRGRVVAFFWDGGICGFG